MKKAEHYHELLFLIALAWCFGCAVIAEKIGLSHEIGAFVAGFSIARNPISYFITQGLDFFRDFFLVLFFFVLGAKIDLLVFKTIFIPALITACVLLAVKPLVYLLLFKGAGEKPRVYKEMGVRLGQSSEFSLIVALFAFNAGIISLKASQFIQLSAIFTMIVSCYITVFLFPSPLATKEGLKQD